ncbi:hypothetical protein G7Y89_g10154 [Cudoniella acicularis]|uniref:Uncharacterized protein n=1 Tax=Cudoniella acicularis TaxID=354080 RepID=A0A8H4RG26_9HELO|nr:hypothetical protein G7Y89_g10154 [Cudoniella acicularis]
MEKKDLKTTRYRSRRNTRLPFARAIDKLPLNPVNSRFILKWVLVGDGETYFNGEEEEFDAKVEEGDRATEERKRGGLSWKPVRLALISRFTFSFDPYAIHIQQTDNPAFLPTNPPFSDCIHSPFCYLYGFGTTYRLPMLIPDLPSREIHQHSTFEPYPNTPSTKFNNNTSFQFNFMKRLARLPGELRHHIYELVAFSWAEEKQFPSIKMNQGNFIDMARRNFKPIFQKVPVDESFMSETSRVLWESEDRFEQRDGMLDYFKEQEYRFVEDFLAALALFEGRSSYEKEGTRSVRAEFHDPEKKKERLLGLLDDFLDWFWDRVVLDITGFRVNIYAPLSPELIGKHHFKHHFRLSHITFTTTPELEFLEEDDKPERLNPGSAGLTWRNEKLYYVWGASFKCIVRRCESLKHHVGHLRTARIFIELSPQQAQHLIEKKAKVP